MMSISPEAGQPTEVMLLPSIQKAGHMPELDGALMRASTRPYLKVARPCVVMRAEV